MEEWAHLGDVNHKSHPRTGLLQDRVSVHEAPEQRLQPHSSTLLIYMKPQKPYPLSFSSYKKLH